MCAGTFAFEVFAPQLTSMFGVSDHSALLCIRAMRIAAIGFLCVGVNMALQGVFQALNRGIPSLVVSLLRLLIIPLPLAFLFSRLPDAEVLIWIALPVAEAAAAVVAVLFTVKMLKK